MAATEMTCEEIAQFLTCARVGRLGLYVNDEPYVVPVSFVYADGKIFFHTCGKGLKMNGITKKRKVCFEVDETLSDASMFKSVIVVGTVEIISDKKEMIPYLQRLINKYRVPESFDTYMNKPGRNRDKELEVVRICLIEPIRTTGRKFNKE